MDKKQIIYILIFSFFINLSLYNPAWCGENFLLFQRANWRTNTLAVAITTDKNLVLLEKKKKKSTWIKKNALQLKKDILPVFLSTAIHGRIELGYFEGNTKKAKIFEVKNWRIVPIKTVETEIFPDEIKIKKLKGKIIKTLVPETSFSHVMFSRQSPAPTHVLVFNREKSIILRVYPLKKYIDMWLEHGDFSIKIAVTRLKRFLKGKKKLITPPITLIPPRPGLNDLAIFTDKIKFKKGEGVGFVGRIAKDVKCITPDDLKYYFIGFTNDNKFIISLEAKVDIAKNSEIPESIWKCKRTVFGVMQQAEVVSKILPQKQKVGQLFKPPLSAIRSMVKSLEVRERRRKPPRKSP